MFADYDNNSDCYPIYFQRYLGSDIDRPSDVISELQPCTLQFYEEHKDEVCTAYV